MLLTWVKLNEKNGEVVTGLGHYTRQCCEYLLLGTSGKKSMAGRRIRKDISSALFARRGRHSQKPKEAYRTLEATFGGRRALKGKCIELFARGKVRRGWVGWGNEVHE